MTDTPAPQSAPQSAPVTDDVLRQLFLDARTHNAWQDRAVEPATLKRLWDLARMGPTSANSLPARIVFVTSPDAKETLRPCLSEGNRDKSMAAPVTAIIGHDLRFYEHLPRLFPHKDMTAMFEGKPALIAETAFRNGALQGGYLILAARALGLDCGPMSGFDAGAVDAAFFAGTDTHANFLCNLGYGDPKGLYPRSPRLDFDEACRIV
jgi:3-hydroxypropanoate dehydrogenase